MDQKGAGPSKVPSRFSRPWERLHVVADEDDIPVFHLADLETEAGLSSLEQACRNWGSFHLIGHGVDSSIVQDGLTAAKSFFSLPEEGKQLYAVPDSVPFTEGYRRYTMSLNNAIRDWREAFYHEVPPRSMDWPCNPPKYRDGLKAYIQEIKILGDKLYSAMLKALDHPNLDTPFPDSTTSVEVNFYPPCPEPDLVLEIVEHSDAGSMLTIVLQDDVEGLQVLKGGKWKSIKSAPNSFMVIVGNITEVMTNGSYKSLEHRAMISSAKARMSIATFRLPHLDSTIKPLILENTPMYKEVSMKEYIDTDLNDKSQLEWLKL